MEESTEKKSVVKESPCVIYSLVAPANIRPLSDFNVAVNLHKSEKERSIKVAIIGNKYEYSKTVDLTPHSTKLINFKIPDIESGDFRIHAKGCNGFKFSEEGCLKYQENLLCVLFQTDKSTYKPGDLVRYRILVLNSFLRPIHIETPIEFWIEDADHNRVQQQKNIKLENNIYAGELQLSECPILGLWTIGLKVREVSHTKNFEVQKYVLPKFEVLIDAPGHVLFKNKKFKLTVKGKYTFGKPVQGKAVVRIFDCVKTLPVEGKACFEFDLEEDLRFVQQKRNSLFIEAEIEESPSGETQQARAQIHLCCNEYELRNINVPYCFTPGTPFEIETKLEKYDGSALTQKAPVYLFLESHEEPGTKFNVAEHSLDKNDTLKTMMTIDGEKKSYAIKLQYLEQYFLVGFVYNRICDSRCGDIETETPCKTEQVDASEEPRLKVNICNQKPLSINEELVLKVSSNKNLSKIFYQIGARGEIIISNCAEVPADTKSHDIKLKVLPAMVPRASIFVYTVYEDKFIYHETAIVPNPELPSDIQIGAPTTAKPGENVAISVKTQPNLCVGLLGIDKSSTLLNNENELTPNSVIRELGQFHNSSYSIYPGCDSGMVLVTNAEIDLGLEVACEAMYWRCGAEEVPECCEQIVLCEELTESAPLEVRKEFPEVWIWDEIPGSSNNGVSEIKTKVPDSITTWLLSGFTLDPVTGLNLTKQPTELQVFQNFFVSAELPYSVKQGEIFELPVSLFNYTKNELISEVILDNVKQEFEFLTDDKQNTKKETLQAKQIVVSPDMPGTVSFLIRPKVVGSITIRITAETPVSKDRIERLLVVEPEGVTKFNNNPILIDLREQNSFQGQIFIDIPKDVVLDSTHIYVTAIGDLLGPIFSNLDDLVRLPYGCGEQNMVNFVPNILVLKYLKAIGSKMEKLQMQATKYLEIGYQRELTYKHPDGSYSLFGPSDTHYKSSTWLTAYVTKSFRQASDLTHIDEGVIKSGLDFIANLQTEKGSFPEFGITESLPADDDPKGLTVTAFSLLALLENSKVYPEFEDRIKKGLDYLAKQVTGSDNINFIAICAYALQLGNHKDKKSVIKLLDEKANVESGRRWWKPQTKSAWNPREVETTSYALLAFLEDETTPLEHVTQILKWMLSRRNDKGGFHSSQDTVIGLQAITKAAQKLYSGNTELAISFVNDTNESKSMNINKDNSLILQSEELPVTTKEVIVHAKGHGTALVQVSYKYNVNMKVTEPKFVIIPEVSLNPEIRNIKLTFVTHFIAEHDGPSSSSMAIMEVTLPSGYIFNAKSKDALLSHNRVKKVELKKMDTLVIIYFDFLDTDKLKISFGALKSHNVDDQKPVPVVVYDYYNKSYQARAFYSLPDIKKK